MSYFVPNMTVFVPMMIVFDPYITFFVPDAIVYIIYICLWMVDENSYLNADSPRGRSALMYTVTKIVIFFLNLFIKNHQRLLA